MQGSTKLTSSFEIYSGIIFPPIKLIGLLTWAKIAQSMMVSSQSVYFIWVICTQFKKMGFSTLIPKVFTQKNTQFYLQCTIKHNLMYFRVAFYAFIAVGRKINAT